MRAKLGMFSSRNLSPGDLPSLTAWWDASDASTMYDATSGGSLVAADGAVARFEDKSGAGRHFTQSTSGNRPIRKSAAQNGLDVLRFDGTNHRMLSTTTIGSIVGVTQSLVFVVAKATSISTNNADIYRNPAVICDAGVNGFFAVKTSGTASAYHFQLSTLRVSEAPYTAGDWVVFSARHDGTNITARINGVDATPAAITEKWYLSDTLKMCSDYYEYVFFNGDVGEVIAYNTALAASERDAIELYLRNKWAI